MPDFSPGDTVRVSVKVVEGERARTQAFEGVCIARSNKGLNSNFTVRKISYGEGVERVFPLYSPVIAEIAVVRRGDVRRAKLYYLRGRSGKSARIAERARSRPAARPRPPLPHKPTRRPPPPSNAASPERESAMADQPRTLFDKIWDSHVVERLPDGTCILYIDRHLVHEVTSPQAFEGLRTAGRRVRRPDATIAVVDHNVATSDRRAGIKEEDSRIQVETLERNVAEFGVPYIPLLDARQGIVHIIGPELGISLPGMTIVCGDSHTSTHGAMGALAFGIGTSEVEHVLATQTLLQKPAKNMLVVGRWRAAVRRDREGHGAGDHRADRHRRRQRPRDRVCGRGDARARHGRADDGVQHVDRGGRARRADRAGRDDVRLYRRAAAGAEGCGARARDRILAHAADRRRCALRPHGVAGCGGDRADGDVGHQPRGGGADHRLPCPIPTPCRTRMRARSGGGCSTTWH